MEIITDDLKLRKSWKKQFSENLQQGASGFGGGNLPQIQITPHIWPYNQVMCGYIHICRSLVLEQ